MLITTDKQKQDKELRRFREERDWYSNAIEETKKLPDEETKLYLPLLEASFRNYDGAIRATEEGKPLLASYWSICPELYRAMDIDYYCIQAHHFQNTQKHLLTHDLEECDKLGLARDNCSLLRLAYYHVKEGVMPTPTMVIHKLEPCDALLGFHEAVRLHWRDIPAYSLDPPYWSDDRTFDYYKGEVKGVVSFLEENTGRKLDLDRLREVVEESNKAYKLWMEYAELRRAVPCPHDWVTGMQVYPMIQIFGAGDPLTTSWIQTMVEDAEKRVKANQAGVDPERFRLLYFEVMGQWIWDLAAWLEQEWNANIVMDMSQNCPYEMIDTSTEDTMLRGLGKRTIDHQTMVRQVRGTADMLLADLRRLVIDYKIDGVIPPTHIGHKDQMASLRLMRAVCRELGVAFLDMGSVDIFDPRFTPMDAVQQRLSQQFEILV